MNSCHEEGVRDRNRAGIDAADPEKHSGERIILMMTQPLINQIRTPCPFPLGGGGGVSHPSPLASTGVRLPQATRQGTNPDKTMRKCPGTPRARMQNTRT
eukprot:gene6565-biopygen13739